MLLRFVDAYPWYVVFEGDDGAGNDGGTDDNGGTGGDDSGAGGAGGGAGGKGDDNAPKFTQAQVNKLLAENKRNLQKTVETQVKELENLRKSKSLSDKERDQLSTRIEELNNSLLTKEQLTVKEREKLATQHKQEREMLTGERDFWKNAFHDSTITRSIADEAAGAEAYSTSQIVELLKSKTRLVEVLDEEGKPIPGEFIAKVKLTDTDKEGKPTTLDLTVKEALKRMKDRESDFGNLFKSGVAGGLGDSKSRTTSKDVDPSKMTPAQFREWRKKRGW